MAASLGGAVATSLELSLANISAVALISVSMSTMPDKMEYIAFGFRWVKHRTLSHWVIPWVLLVVSSVFFGEVLGEWGTVLLLGIGIGGVGHLLGDFLTPMGVPLLFPTRKFSVSWPISKSWYHELLIVVVFFLVCNVFTGWKWLKDYLYF